ncbi:MAG TPA: long-chain fatty acid--CoA ligase [Asanoa sp.]|nr:long-chain fatty acid--CoA ligase [Asanoa sp.]
MRELFPEPVLASLRAAPDRPAIEDGSRTVSRGALHAMVARIAANLARAGLGSGDGVGMVLSLTPEAYAAHLAAHALGFRVAAARPAWSAPQLRHALQGTVDAVVADRPIDVGIRVLPLADLLAASPGDASVPQRARADDVARLTFTSGSTGSPKACAHTYRAISLAYQTREWPPALARLLGHFERCLVTENLASPVMVTYLGRTLVAGGTVVLPAGLTPPQAIEAYGITATMTTPARLHQTLRADADLRSLRAVLIGGSPAGPQFLRAAERRLGPIVWQGYGQAEAGVIAMLTPEDIASGHEESVGRPLPAVEVAVRAGEVCVRSSHMMVGYWNDPEQSAEVLRDGWLHTRDLGYVDDGGFLCLTGRSRDVIMVNAEVCYAGAVERVLAAHPDVAQAYVVGVPDPVTGEAIHAFVVPAGARVPAAAELTDLVRRTLSANSVPALVTVIRDVPVGAGGKPDKAALTDRTGTVDRA